MKKILFFIVTISSVFVFKANAQWCGTVASCNAPVNTQLGFPNSDSIPCIHQGTAYNYAIPFKMYAQFTFEGTHQLDSLTFDTLLNLPCGLCWSLSKASKTYYPNELGCLNISGTTNDVVGQYNIEMQMTAYLTGGGGVGQTINPGTVSAAGINVYLRVAGNTGTCMATDTNIQTQVNQVSAYPCITGINEVMANVETFNIVPNPMNSTATLTFVAEKNASYVVRIMDVTGKLISNREMQVVPGINTTAIDRGKLSAGVYLVSVSDGVSWVTRKLSVVE